MKLIRSRDGKKHLQSIRGTAYTNNNSGAGRQHEGTNVEEVGTAFKGMKMGATGVDSSDDEGMRNIL